MEKDFDVMKWLRGVRDAHYEILKDKSEAERSKWYREEAAKLRAETGGTQAVAPGPAPTST